jgi:hypothetical protein
MTGWSRWSDYSRCLTNWQDDCTKARYRFCVDSNDCPGANRHGTQEEVKRCSPAECKSKKNKTFLIIFTKEELY